MTELEIQKKIKRMFDTYEGKEVLDYLMQSYVLASPFSANSTGLQIAYCEGKSDLVRLFYQIVNSKI